jgi:hypothetical protein
MKKLYLFLLSFCLLSGICAQLTITSGAQFALTGNAQLTLSNIDLVNNGIFSAGAGSVLFNGNTVSHITGSQNTTLYDLNIGKTAGSVQLQVPIAISHQVIFTSGLLDLNGNDLNLGTTGMLVGEQEVSHIIGPNGGNVAFTASLNAPSSANPANLGIVITSTQNLGNTVIRRGHLSQTNIDGSGSSILRYYDIQPANNTSLNATLRLNYFDEELNGLDENALALFEKQGTQKWMNLGSDSRNTNTDYVEKNGISSMGRFTLSSSNSALPVKFIAFNTQCNGNAVLITWKTAQEINSNYYLVEKSSDGILWSVLGNVPAAGNAAVENDYSYVDNNAANGYYRIAEYDLDGKTTYTSVLSAACNSQEAIKIWPNPASDIVYINMTVHTGSEAVIRLFDSKGALVKQQAAGLIRGNNLINIDIKGISSGLYFATITYNNGEQQTEKIIKK